MAVTCPARASTFPARIHSPNFFLPLISWKRWHRARQRKVFATLLACLSISQLLLSLLYFQFLGRAQKLFLEAKHAQKLLDELVAGCLHSTPYDACQSRGGATWHCEGGCDSHTSKLEWAENMCDSLCTLYHGTLTRKFQLPFFPMPTAE
jgi:hypothetical protein